MSQRMLTCVFGATALVFVIGCDGDAADSGATSNSSASATGEIRDNSTAGAANASVATGAASQAPPETAIRFQDITGESGVQFMYRNGQESDNYAIVESLGGGIAVLDADGDGDEDLLFPGGGRIDTDLNTSGLPCGLFLNSGDATFADSSMISGADAAGRYSHGAAAADFDGDGFRDVLITGYGGLQLLQNQGDGTFIETASAAGLTDSRWSSSAAWGDISRDGALDVYVAHYVDWSKDKHPFCQGPTAGQREVCPPRDFNGLPDTLYFSDGSGAFTDESQALQPEPDGKKGLGVIMADVNGDRLLDVYVTNDTVPNTLYYSTEAGTLENESLMSGTSLSDRGVPDGSMGVELLDFNGDGLFDIWVTNYERESSALYQNHSNQLFRHSSQRLGVNAVGALYVGWGTCAIDADQDGDEDIFVSNGHVIRFPNSGSLKQQPLMFDNQAGRRLVNVARSAGSFFTQEHMGRGAVAADLDDDGDLDLVVSHNNDPAAVLRNDTATGGSWLKILLTGTVAAREAIGTVVRVTTTDENGNAVIQSRQWKGGGSYGSTGSRWMHFGLGKAEQADSVSIEWPSGEDTSFENVRANSRWHAVESRTELISVPR